MQKILFAGLLGLCLLLTACAGCTGQPAEVPDPVNYSSPIGSWAGLPDASGVYLGMTLGTNGTGTYGYYTAVDSSELQVEWYEYSGKYYVHNATSRAGDVFRLSEDGKSMISESGDTLYRK